MKYFLTTTQKTYLRNSVAIVIKEHKSHGKIVSLQRVEGEKNPCTILVGYVYLWHWPAILFYCQNHNMGGLLCLQVAALSADLI